MAYHVDVTNSLPGRPWRRSALLMSLFLAAVALTGCVKVDLAATIGHDDTVNGELTAAVSDRAISRVGSDQAGQFVDLFTADFPGAYRHSDFHAQGFTGRTVYFSEVNLAEFTAPESQQQEGSTLSIVHTGDRYDLDGRFDLSQLGSVSIPNVDPDQLRTARFTVAITFPGPVTRHNGELSGNTVTWNLRIGQDNIMYAQADQSNSAGRAWIVLEICVALMVLVMVLLYVQLRRYSLNRRR